MIKQTLAVNSLCDIYKSNAVDLKPILPEEDVSDKGKIDASDPNALTALEGSAPIEAIVFDIYGTLVISASGDISIGEQNHGKQDNLARLLNKYDIDLSPGELSKALEEEILRDHKRSRQMGIEYPEVDIRKIWQELPDTAHLGGEEILQFATEYESLVNPVAPMPGMGEILSLVNKSGIPMGIVSNAQFYTQSMFSAFLEKTVLQLGFHPDLLIYSYLEGHGKPSLHLFEKLAKRLSNLQHPGHGIHRIKPENCLYVGNDMLKDIWAASQCGFKTAFFAGDRRSCRTRRDDPRCANLQADFLLHTLYDIRPLLPGAGL